MPASILETLQSYADMYLVDPERAAREYYTDDVVMRTSGEHQFAGDHCGRDAILSVLAAIRRWTDGTIRLSTVLSVAVGIDDAHAVVDVHIAASRQGECLTWERVLVYGLQMVGDVRLITEMKTFDFEQARVDAFFGGPASKITRRSGSPR